MKAVILAPKEVEIPEGAQVPAGVMSVIPSGDMVDDTEMGPFSVISAGQYLSRELYPELSHMFSETGGLHLFQLPALEHKFLLGWEENGNPIVGDGIVYFQTFPEKL